MSSEIPISRTKILVPPLRPEILHRPRLLALFDDLLDKKLIIVAAPAGYGKTTLLVDFARQNELPVCWLSLDPLDQDPQRFIASLIAAIEARFHQFGSLSNAVVRSLTDPDQELERVLSVLINEIAAQIDEHFALVVDDYQFVDVIPTIRDFFSRFVYQASENCHVILSTRRLPTLPEITLMVARQQVGGFDLEQLAFRPKEIRSLFETSYGVSLSDRAVEELMEHTEGWVTGLHLAVSPSEHGVPDLSRAAHATGVDLAEYLDQQILSQQTPRVRKFLLQTSVMEEFDADLCQRVLGSGDWRGLIKLVRQNNLFVLPVGAGGKWLRYHHLFQEFLQERLRQDDPQQTQTLLTRLTEVYAEAGEWEKAYATCKRLADPEQLADLIERAGVPMLMSERLYTYRTWLDELPSRLLYSRPRLLSHKGALLCAHGDGRRAREVLDLAIGELRQSGETADLATALVRRAAASRLLGDYLGSLQVAEEALRLVKGRSSLQAIHAEAERFRSINLNTLGRMTEAVRAGEEALRRYERLGERTSVARVQVELGASYRSIGNYPAAHAMYESALAEWRRQNSIPLQASALNNLGVLYHYQGEYEQAVRAFESGLACARQSDSPWRESLLLASLGDLYADLDEYDSAEQSYASAAEVVRKVDYQFLADYLCLAEARLARSRGKVRQAQMKLSEAERRVESTHSSYEHGLFYLERGCFELVERNAAGAQDDLGKALEIFRQGGLEAETTWSQVWLAAAQVACGETEAAHANLQAALGTHLPGESLTPLSQNVRQARPWLLPLRGDPQVGGLVSAWLEGIHRAERGLPALRKRLRKLLVSVPIQAPRLSIQAFGKARVRANGRNVTLSQWKTASVRELFFYFLCAPHSVTKEEVGELFWPELTPQQLKLRFKNDLYRLRRALGQDVILFEDDHYRFNLLVDYDYDVENFRSALDKARRAVTMEEKIAHLTAATSLRTGPFLQDLDAKWRFNEAAHLDAACLAAYKELAALQRQVGLIQAALHSCEAALRIDPCREDFHRLAMQLHADQGDRLAVIWQYKACQEALRTELEVIPSDETQLLYQQLTN